MAFRILVASLALIIYAYAGYPALCWLRARLFKRPIKRAPIRPRVSLLIAAWREADNIGPKIESLAQQTYPRELVEVVVSCDGSDDGTADLARAAGERFMPGRLGVVENPRRGKPAALNAAAGAASGEVFVFSDARQPLSPNAVQVLVEDLGDPEVGAVGGALEMGGEAPAGAYWKYEAAIRRWEGTSGSTVGVSGALYAIRRELWRALPEETILDDVLAPMRVRMARKRVGFEPEAKAFDTAAESKREFARKVRTLSGNFQLLLLLPSLLSPLSPSWFDFLSHKILRLMVPFAMLAALLAAPLIPWPLGPVLFGAQLAGYSLAAMHGLGWTRARLAGLAETLVVLNAAALVGLLRFLRHGRRLPW